MEIVIKNLSKVSLRTNWLVGTFVQFLNIMKKFHQKLILNSQSIRRRELRNQYPFHILNSFFLTANYRLNIRQEISDLCEYGNGFDFNNVYNLPVAERKLQLMILKRKLEEKASKQNSDSLTLNENSSLQQIKNLSQKFENSHDFAIPKK